MRLLRALALAGTFAVAAFAARAEVAVPALQSRVTDLTGTLSADDSSRIEAKLTAFEQRKGSQIAVLIVPTTEPETIEQYGIRVAEAWKLGRKGVDDGAILLVARNDRALRIEVGYGLEGALNDATAKRIVAEIITPRFRSGDFAGGIDAGVEQMIAVIGGEPLLPPPRSGGSGQGSGQVGVAGLLMPFFVVWFLGRILRRIFGTGLAALAVGGVTGAIAFFLLASLGLAIGIGLLAAIVAFILYVGGGGGGFYGGPRWGGSLGGGSFGGGGGGFGGGGGSFGGGGASGNW